MLNTVCQSNIVYMTVTHYMQERDSTFMLDAFVTAGRGTLMSAACILHCQNEFVFEPQRKTHSK